MMHRLTVVLTMGALIACVARDGDTDATSDTAPASAAPNVVTFTASDFAFEGPDTISAGLTTIRLVNRGPAPHHAQLVRFDDGKTLVDFEAALKAGGPMPPWVHEVGGPNPPPNGQESATTQMLEPGSYAVVCLVDVPDRVPHIMKGMAQALTVVPQGNSAGAEPPADVTMTLSDYAFTTSAPLTTGAQTIRVVNEASQPHEVVVFKLAPGKTVDDLMQWAQSFQGPPPAETYGGVAAVERGRPVYFTVDLNPASYVLLCFVPDATDGKPHVAHGMVQTFTLE